MKMVLGRKQSMTAADEAKWWNVINHIEEYVSRDEVESVTAEALDRIKSMTTGRNSAYMWSGGKDSLVIADLCQRAGISKCYCLVTELEYPAWLKFLQYNKPPDCEMINVGYDLEYLANHEEMLFARRAASQNWNRQIQAFHIERYLRDNDVEVVILGRRKIDGNSCGRNGFILKRGGKATYSPIYDWSHELLFGYLHYNELKLPEIYSWRRGFYNGTHIWAERKVASVEQGYCEVYEIAPSVVIEAAKVLPSAKEFLECRLSQNQSAN